jgi:CheY-like chemotaxis protein
MIQLQTSGVYSTRRVQAASHAPIATTPQKDIVVADDEIAIALVVAELLAEEGYHVRTYHDGASALLGVTRHRPMLVLLDITMPVMSGDEVLVQLRSSGFQDLPVILMSAGVRLSDFRSLGATDFIAKPFDLQELLSCIEAHAEQQRLLNRRRDS